MKYRITFGESHYHVILPETLPDGAPMMLQLASQTLQAAWHRSLGVLSITSPSGVEQNIRVRSHQVTRLDGESDSHVALEAWTQGIQSVSGVVSFDIPGLENNARHAATSQIIRSQMTGKALKVLVSPGDAVKPGDPLVIIEAMKMENKIFSAASGTVASVSVKAGDAVQTGKELLRISL